VTKLIESLPRPRSRDPVKWGFFAVLAALVALSAYLDDRFVFDPQDEEWRRLATWTFLLPHAIGGIAALLIGPLQFSNRLRASRPRLHRLLGRIYVGACLFAGPTAVVVALQHHPMSQAVPQTFQGGLWTIATGLAFYYAVRRQFAAHRLWMMRSYGFCLIFVLGRLPDIDPHFDWNGVPGVTVLWSAIIIALIGPDFILAARSQSRRRV
jgi:uncharacterized membrane protein